MQYAQLALCIFWMLLSGCVQDHSTALIKAAASGDVQTVEALLAKGANPNQASARGETPLIAAARAGSVPAVKVLLSHGANPDLHGGVNRWTPLMHAIHKNQIGTAQALLEGGAQVDARGRSGETALMMAAGYGYTPIVELLLDRGADPWAQTSDGATVFSIALGGVPDIDRFTVASCQAPTVQLLKRRYPSLSLPDNLWGRAAKLSAVVAKLRGCAY